MNCENFNARPRPILHLTRENQLKITQEIIIIYTSDSYARNNSAHHMIKMKYDMYHVLNHRLKEIRNVAVNFYKIRSVCM